MIYIHNKFFFDYMNVELLDSSSNEANIAIKEGDIGTLYIIQHEVWPL